MEQGITTMKKDCKEHWLLLGNEFLENRSVRSKMKHTRKTDIEGYNMLAASNMIK